MPVRTQLMTPNLCGGLGPVRVVHDSQIEGLGIDEPGDVGVLAVLCQQVMEKPQHGLGTGDLRRVPPSFDVHGWFVGVLAGLPVRHRDLPDVAALEGLSNRIELDEVRIVLGPLCKELIHLVVGVKMPKVQLALPERFNLGIVHFREEASSVAFTADEMKEASALSVSFFAS